MILTHTQNALTSSGLSEEHREALEATERAAQRMRRLIDTLLELARLDAGQEPLRRAECDLSKIAADSIALLRPLAAARRIEIREDLAAAACTGDPERLAQVVANLLSNAIEYGDAGGDVYITTRGGSGPATLAIHNSGPAIPAGDLPRLFERFHRADAARTGGRAGLGLAICTAIVAAHGGSIGVESAPGAGTTFTVALPAGAVRSPGGGV